MNKTMFRDTLQWGVVAVAAMASIQAATAQPVSLGVTELDRITAGANVNVTVWSEDDLVKYVIKIDGHVVRKGTCADGCAISYVNDGNTVRLNLK